MNDTDHDDDDSQAGGAKPGEALQDLRAILFEAIRAVRAGTLPLDRARMVNELAKTTVDTGHLEVAHKKVVQDAERSKFIDGGDDQAGAAALPNGITAIVQHRLRG